MDSQPEARADPNARKSPWPTALKVVGAVLVGTIVTRAIAEAAGDIPGALTAGCALALVWWMVKNVEV